MTTAAFFMQADNHNLAADADKTFVETLGDSAASVAKFIGLSAGAAINELTNIPASVGNLFGGDYKIDTMEDRLADYDSDLLKYYEDHKAGIDIAGFVAGSFAPGLGGMKVLNVGQAAIKGALGTGKIGAGSAKALGLLVPERDAALKLAVKDLSEVGSTFSMTNANTIKTLAAGFGEQTLQAFAFETAVAATMTSSPILSQANAGDIVANIGIGTVLGGGIGGVLVGAHSIYSIKKALTGINAELHPWGLGDVKTVAGNTAAERALAFRYHIDNMPDPMTAPETIRARAVSMHAQTTDASWLEVRSALQDFAGGDTALAQALFEQAKLNSAEDFSRVFMAGVGAGRVGKTTHLDAQLREVTKKYKSNALAMSPEELDIYMNHHTSYVKVHGEGTEKGILNLDDRPAVLSITDLYDDISFKADGMYSKGKRVYAMEHNPHIPYNIEGLSHYQTEARQFWAEHLPKWKPDEIKLIHANDLPLLEKAMKECDAVKIIPVGGKIDEAVLVSGADNIKQAVIESKRSLNISLRTRNVENDPRVARDKLRSLLGINLNEIDEAGLLARWRQRTDPDGSLWQAIDVHREHLKAKNLLTVAKSIEHERGHDQFQAMLRGLTNDFRDSAVLVRPGMTSDLVDRNFAAVIDELMPEITKISKRVRPGMWKQAKADPGTKEYLTEAHELMADSFSYFSMHPEQLSKFPAFDAYAGHLIKPMPQEVKDALMIRAKSLSNEEIAKITNMHSSALDGSAISPEKYFARDLDRQMYYNKMQAAGTRAGEQVVSDPLMLPKHAKLVHNTKGMPDGFVVDGMAHLEQRKVLFQESAMRVATDNLAKASPELADMAAGLPATRATDIIAAATEGPGIATSANANYGTGGSKFAYVGQVVHRMINKAKEITGNTLTPVLHRVGNDLDAAVEWSVLNEKVRASPYRYILSETGDMLVAKLKPADFAELKAAGDELIELPIKNANTRELVSAHMTLNSTRQSGLSVLDAAQGIASKRQSDVFYPIPRSPNNTPFYAYVVDDSVQGVGHSQMIYAKDSATLELLKQEALRQNPQLKILTKDDSIAYHKAHGQFNFEQALNEKLFDVTKTRLGTSASFMPRTDPAEIVRETLEWHHARDAAFVRANVSHIYQPEFDALQRISAGATSAAKSKFGYVSAMSKAETAVADPHSDLIKMALDVSKKDTLPLYSNLNKMLDEKVSAVWNGFTNAIRSATHPDQLEAVQAALDKAGYKGLVVNSDSLYQAMNGTVSRGTLGTFVNKVNALISTFALRLDPLNALNNLVGSQVLLNTELNSLLRGIEKASPEAAGELAALGKISVPGTGKLALSPTKMIAKAIADFHSDAAGREFFKQHGFTSTISEQYDQSLDLIAITLKDGNVNNAFTKMKDLGVLGEKWSGNTIAEEMNRYVAAHVMKQVTDLAMKHGVISSEAEALGYINTFVNRTQGNYLASQRPLMFQGPIGQAIGLFQTYQFNLIQQLLRHIGEGDAKSAVRMMALQGSIYGLQGLPAFNAINTHILGNAPGNTNHRDVYKTVFESAGKEAGEWLMYGGLSNLPGLLSPDAKMNMYTRGDVNPRNLFVVPTSPTEVPIYQATVKVLGNIFNTAQQMANSGAVGESLLRGLEHNGISRPLAGFAQVLEGIATGKVEATSKTDSLLMSHDVANWASMTRLLGGKPLDEAITQDAAFRLKVYSGADKQKREQLGASIKMNVLSGADIQPQQWDGFMEAYLKSGGKQTEFNRFVLSNYRNATITQADQIKNKLSDPRSRYMQVMMNDGFNSLGE